MSLNSADMLRYKKILSGLANNRTLDNACKSQGITIEEFHFWKDCSPETQSLFSSLKDKMTDNVELSLYGLCTKEKNVNAIKFWLANARPKQWDKKSYIVKDDDKAREKHVSEVKQEIKTIFNLDDSDLEDIDLLDRD